MGERKLIERLRDGICTTPARTVSGTMADLGATRKLLTEAANALAASDETCRLLHRRVQEAESAAYRKAGRWHRALERCRIEYRDYRKMMTDRENKLRQEIAWLEIRALTPSPHAETPTGKDT